MHEYPLSGVVGNTLKVGDVGDVMITDGGGYDAVFVDPIELLKVLKEKEPEIYAKMADFILSGDGW